MLLDNSIPKAFTDDNLNVDNVMVFVCQIFTVSILIVNNEIVPLFNPSPDDKF